jgi:pimeloyl-ACP methyl ester carboxylesterase
VVVCFP